MYTVMATFLPSLVGLKVMDYLLRGLTKKNLIFYYGILLILSQTIVNIIAVNKLDIEKSLWDSLNMGTEFFSIYVLISIATNLLLAVIFTLIIKNIKIEVEVKYAESNKNKKAPVKVANVSNKQNSQNRKKPFSKIKKHFQKNKNK